MASSKSMGSIALAVALATGTASAAVWQELEAEAAASLVQQRPEAARDAAKRALWHATMEEGAGSFAEAITLTTLAKALDAVDEYDVSLPYKFRSLKIRVDKFGAKSAESAYGLYGLAISFDGLRDYQAAEMLYTKAIEIANKAEGEDSVLHAKMLVGLGSYYVRVKQFDQAEPVLMRALHVLEAHLGGYDPAVAAACKNLSFVFKNKGHPESAEEYSARADAIRAIARDLPAGTAI